MVFTIFKKYNYFMSNAMLVSHYLDLFMIWPTINYHGFYRFQHF